MYRRLALICAILVSSILPLADPILADEADLPNIVLLFADDLGYGDLGCYGHPYVQTPNIDKLAAQGTRFTQAYVTGITCGPSRTGLMTGKFPASFQNNAGDFGFGKRVAITQLLKQRGYATGHFGKWHIGPVEKDGTYGIDQVGGDRERDNANGRDNYLYSNAIEFIKANKDKPFYINVWGHSTHYPVAPPKKFARRYAGLEVDPADFGPTVLDKFADVKEMRQDIHVGMRNYCADVSALDHEVGRIMKTLDELGIADHTIVVFSSDHGPAPVGNNKDKRNFNAALKSNMLGSPGPHRGGKHTMLEGGVRVPFIIRWPGNVSTGRVDSESVISTVDWLPTLASITGIQIDTNDFDGEDVSPVWLDKQRHTRTKPLLWRTSSSSASVGIRHGKWKMYTARDGRRGEPLQLYDVIADPLEQKNLAADRPGVVKQLTEMIDAWRASLPTEYRKNSSRRDKRKNDRNAE